MPDYQAPGSDSDMLAVGLWLVFFVIVVLIGVL